jgi:AGZA family xanthine/uracil permease-like MFS transporter
MAAWGVLMARSGLRAAGVGGPAGPPLTDGVLDAFLGSDVWMRGGFALDQGFIFTSMILSAGTVMIIERRFRAAAGWFATGAVLSAAGLMHSWKLTPQDAVMSLRPAWPYVAGYAFVAALLLVAPWVTERDEAGHG